jgi:hypothetical protein
MMAKAGTLREIYSPRLRAMERQCVHRMGDGCPCENIIDCRIPDALLIADIGLQLIDYRQRFELLRKRWAEQNGHKYQSMEVQKPTPGGGAQEKE